MRRYSEVHLVRYEYVCDYVSPGDEPCGKVAMVEVDLDPKGELPVKWAVPEGWIVAADPRGGGADITFHTRKCAIGWFRRFVAEASGTLGLDDEGPKAPAKKPTDRD